MTDRPPNSPSETELDELSRSEMARLGNKLDDVEIELIPGRGGVFEVAADGEMIHSKKATHRFPGGGEIVGALRAR